jgi:glycosyltransferase involved in cell wall biosynthesis
MLVSVIMDNYNYDSFIKESIESVLNQTYTNFELIIVDDGSSDNSKNIIKEYAKKDNRIKPIFKQNGGQASALNVGFNESNGNILTFIDSDDVFENNKLEQIVNTYKNGYEYIINDYEVIGDKRFYKNYFPYGGYNLFLIYYINYFVGSSTSNISLSKNLSNKIFPIKYEEFFRIRADDYIVFSAGMLANIYFINQKLSKYRIHGENLFICNKDKYTSDYKYNREIVLHKIKKESLNKLDIDKRFFENPYNLFLEFTTKTYIDKFILKKYLEILFFEMKSPIMKKIEIAKKILSYYLKGKK